MTFEPSETEIVFEILADGSLRAPNFSNDMGEYPEHDVLAMAQQLAEQVLQRRA
jgi:hypothetical protein